MRHGKHPYKLGVKKEHRQSLLASLAAALFRHGSIRTTLAKAKALRPFAEKNITLACKALRADDKAEVKLHYRRMAVANVRDHAAVKMLFDSRAESFLSRPGGYTRIYKLMSRKGDASKMAIIEMVAADDRGYGKKRHRQKQHAQHLGGKNVETAECGAKEVEVAGVNLSDNVAGEQNS